MVNYFDLYKRRLELEGVNSGDSLVKSTEKYLKSAIQEHPFYKKIFVDNRETGAIVEREQEFDGLVLHFEPNETFSLGDIVEIDNEEWIIVDYSIDIEKLYPKTYISFCNNYLEWKNNDDETVSYPCNIIGNVSISRSIVTDRHNMNLPDDALTISLPYNDETQEINYYDKFTINKRAWRVIAVDNVSKVKNGKGLLYLILEPTLRRKDNDKEIIEDGYHIVIEGDKEISVDGNYSYYASVYHDQEFVTDEVEWSVDNSELAEIDSDGVLTTYNKTGVVKIIAEYKDEEEEIETEKQKDVRIYDESDWW